MRAAPAVSVVIPTFKRPERLRTAIEFALQQTAQPLLIVVADNDPSHSARPVALEFKAAGALIEYLEAGSLSGPAFARNRGAERCSTEWIAFLDDDDEWEPEYLQSAIGKAEDDQCDVVLTWIGLRTSGTTSAVKRLSVGLTLDEIVKSGNPGITGSNIIIKKSVFQQLSGFDEQYLASEDIDLLMRIVANNIGYAVNTNVQVFHIIHDDGHLSDLATGAVTTGAARLLQQHGSNISLRARNKLRAKIHYASFSSTDSLPSKLYHSIVAATLGERRAIKSLVNYINPMNLATVR